MGVDKMPHCFDGVACKFANWVIDHMVYTSYA